MQQDDIVIEDREELFYLLAEAAEFEHAVMCTYLYAMWSLKRSTAEGVTEEELKAIDRWRSSLRQVALEEMLHLTLVNNILAATGASPHLWRPPFPVAPGEFPVDVVMRLSPFTEASMDHFQYIERPEGIELKDGEGFSQPELHRPAVRPDLLAPTPRDYDSQGQLYHAILRGLAKLCDQIGERNVFVGHGEAQVGMAEFGLPGLFKVTDLASAKKALEIVVTQGEGAPAHMEGSHYQRFAQIGDELIALKKARPAFEPARAVTENPALDNPRMHTELVVICDPLTSKVVDLGNALYALMMRTFAQVFSPAPLPRELRIGFAQAATELMYAMSYVGEVVTAMPVGASHPGLNAGLTFALPQSSGQLVQRCAAQILGERVRELAVAAEKLEASVALPGIANRLKELAAKFAELHTRFEEHLTAAVNTVVAAPAAKPAAPAPVAASSATDDPNVAKTRDITLKFDAARCIHSRHCVLGAPSVFLANVKGPWLHPETVTTDRVAEVAHNCPSGAITYERHDGKPQEKAPDVNVLRVRENGPYAVHAGIELKGCVPSFRATLCRCGRSANKPYCDNSHKQANFTASGEPATIESEPLQNRGGTLTITPLKDGPLQVVGNLEICSGTGRTLSRVESARLCRCGGSANKPFCDGTHARIGFTSENPDAAKNEARPVG